MRRSLLLSLLITALVAVPASAQTAPSPPSATTGAATTLSASFATVRVAIDPNGSATAFHVEYGTSTAYGQNTGARSAGAGTSVQTINVRINGLAANTTYHYRVVATNAAGTDRGADRTLRTKRGNPGRPSVSTGLWQALTPRSTTLTGTVNPRSQKTSYRFEWGTGTRLNRRTARVNLPAGSATVPVSAAVVLRPNTRYSYRLMATNPTGTVRGKTRRFTSPRAPAALGFDVRSSRVPYQGTAVITGVATSAGAGNVAVILERQFFPYTGPFERIATQRSAADGAYRFDVAPLLLSAKFRVLAQTTPAVTSDTRTVRTTVRVPLKVRRVSNRRLRFTGEILPALAAGRVSLQRRVRGSFRTIRSAGVRHPGPGRASYRITVGARRSATVYRVVVSPPSASGHARGRSRTKRVAGLR